MSALAEDSAFDVGDTRSDKSWKGFEEESYGHPDEFGALDGPGYTYSDDEEATPKPAPRPLTIRLPPRPISSRAEPEIEVLDSPPRHSSSRGRKPARKSSRPRSFYERELAQYEEDSLSDSLLSPVPVVSSRRRKHSISPAYESSPGRDSSPDLTVLHPPKRVKKTATPARHLSSRGKRHSPASAVKTPARRGRPPKPRSPTPEPITSSFYHATIELPGRPMVSSSRTGRAAKVVSAPPMLLGPVKMDTDFDWDSFCMALANGLKVQLHQLIPESFKWRPATSYTASGAERKAPPPKPLTNDLSLDGLHAYILKLANDPKGPTVIEVTVMMATPTASAVPHFAAPLNGFQQHHAPAAHSPSDPGYAIDSRFGPMAAPDEIQGPMMAKKTMAEQLIAPYLPKIEEITRVGACSWHPSERCYYDEDTQRHFPCNSTSDKLWAIAITEGKATLARPPIGQAGWEVNRAKKPPKNPPMPYATPFPGPTGPYPPSPYVPYGGFPTMPYAPPPYAPTYPPFGQPGPVPLPGPSNQAGPSRSAPPADPPSSPLPPASFEEYFEGSHLDDEDKDALKKVGFKAGLVRVAEITPDEWKEASVFGVRVRGLVAHDKAFRARKHRERRDRLDFEF
ncbi:hypothetical protein PENSPDRAFT_669294 [Peniophora sp. CONT]|nr:hypothetical protein PENSPDRAFT_669294 [Peniophora sp. CONT]